MNGPLFPPNGRHQAHRAESPRMAFLHFSEPSEVNAPLGAVFGTVDSLGLAGHF